MAEYLYQCENKHRVTVAHSMLEAPRMICSVCGAEMFRRPQIVEFMKSSFRELSPEIKQHIQDVPRLRDEYEERHNG